MKEGSLRMGASPQTPWLHGAARHYAVPQAEPLHKLYSPEEIITSSQNSWFRSIVAWIVVVWIDMEIIIHQALKLLANLLN